MRVEPSEDFFQTSMKCFSETSGVGFRQPVQSLLKLLRQLFAARPSRIGRASV